MSVRKDDSEVLKSECGCGRPITEVYYCKKCNLVFCGFCHGRHKCKPVDGPVCPKGPEPEVLLPPAPAPAALHPKNGSHKSTPKKKV